MHVCNVTSILLGYKACICRPVVQKSLQLSSFRKSSSQTTTILKQESQPRTSVAQRFGRANPEIIPDNPLLPSCASIPQNLVMRHRMQVSWFLDPRLRGQGPPISTTHFSGLRGLFEGLVACNSTQYPQAVFFLGGGGGGGGEGGEPRDRAVEGYAKPSEPLLF